MQLRGLSSRARAVPAVLMAAPLWRACEALGEAADGAERSLVLLDLSAQVSAELQRPGVAGACPVLVLAPSAEHSLAARFEAQALEIGKRLREQLRSQPQSVMRWQLVAGSAAGFDEPAFAQAFAASFASVRQEQPRLRAQVLLVERTAGAAQVLQAAAQAAQHDAPLVRWQDGALWRREFEECSLGASAAPWRDGGIYLISGGGGGLARIFARDIAAKTRDATVILVGRSALSEQTSSWMGPLRASVRYEQVDVSDAQAVQRLVEGIVSRHGGLHGVIHAAGVLRDGPIGSKDEGTWREVLSPKVAGCVNLDAACASVRLDFMLLCSSLSGWRGNAGQADYAAGNGFLDVFAARRNAQVRRGERQGRTVSINWPLWAEGGMRMSGAMRELLSSSVGMHAMSSGSGLEAFYRALASAHDQVAVIEGDAQRLRAGLFADTPSEARESSAQAQGATQAIGDHTELQALLLDYLSEDVSRALRVKREEVYADAELSEFGFDSISLTDFANRLNGALGLRLMPTVFFEFPSLQALSGHLLGQHPEAIARRLGHPVGGQVGTPLSSMSPAGGAAWLGSAGTRGQCSLARRAPLSRAPIAVPVAREPIAIIGASGAFPKARNLEELWGNLLGERDCIEEIPLSRWDWRAIFGDAHAQPGRTHIKWGGFLGGIEEFDPLFFGISPREARLMDPHQRLLMLHGIGAIEDAGYAPSSLAGSQTGIFVGTATTRYIDRVGAAGLPDEGQLSTGAVPSVGPNRLSFFLDVHGPSEPIETACSSSLVAIDRAVRYLQHDEGFLRWQAA